MNLPKIFTLALALGSAAGAAGVGEPVRPLGNNFVTGYASPSPGNIFCYTPGIARLDSGRVVATLDLGGPGRDQHRYARHVLVHARSLKSGAGTSRFKSSNCF